MAGRTGKRAKQRGICRICKQPILTPFFGRTRLGDEHLMMADGSSGCPTTKDVKDIPETGDEAEAAGKAAYEAL